MTRHGCSAPTSRDRELSALIDTLHDTVRRIEDLTDGEVDAVTDGKGGTLLLGHAHEQLRRHEATRQAAILNALPAHIALIDMQGCIISVNDAWRDFADVNVLQGPGYGIGLNYLEMCDRAAEVGVHDAQLAAAGIRSVLEHRAPSFSMEYACRSQTEKRWFVLTVTPLSDERPDGAVIMHTNITVQKNSAVELQRFGAAMDATVDAIYIVERASMRLIHVNDAACRMQGQTQDELMALGPEGLLAKSREELEQDYDAVIANGGKAEPLELQQRRNNGLTAWVELRRHAYLSGDTWTIVTLVRDISARKEAETRLHHHAHYDGLTGLPNRRLFHETLKKALPHASGNGWQVAVMFMDLDHFKNVNDTLGHAIGDELLIQFSARLTRCLRLRDTVGRLGGDEFALILTMQDGPQGAALVANKIQEAMRPPFDLKGQMIVVNASIGITIYPDDASDPDTLLKYADTAMYKAKQAGRDRFQFFTSQMNVEALARLDLESALRKAIDNNEFELHYQPKIHIESGRIVGLEALVRWHRPGNGIVSPKDFIPALEETGLIVRVGSWVIATACRQIGLWQRSAIGPVHVAVNVSGRQFIEGDLQADIIRGLADNDIAGDLLELELTESLLMVNTERTQVTLDILKRTGVQISIDDFGTGYSSLAYLRRFPIDKLKIDIAFIRDITTDPDDAAITLAIITMAHSLKLQVVAEGVETQAQLAYLQQHHCDQMQGYYFSRPLPLPEIEQMLREERCAALR